MNTPSPCDKCKLLYYDATLKDDAAYLAVCKVGEILGNLNCIYFDMGEMMKRYAIIEVPDSYPGAEYWDTRGNVYVPVLTGPVELMQAACKEAGAKLRIPKIGDWVMYGEGTWHKVVVESDNWEIRPVIPVQKPEEEKPCPNCQNVLSWMMVKKHPIGTLNFPIRQGTGWKCVLCNRSESEWTYAPSTEPGGIGCGGTGGPI